MSPLRLVLLGQFPIDSPPQGGVQAVIANLREALVARGDIDLHLIQHRRDIPPGSFTRDGYTAHNLAAEDNRLFPNMLRTRRLLAPLLRQLAPDAISSHQPEYALPAFDAGLPTVHTIHGFPAQEFWARRGLLTRAATLTEVWLEWQMLRRARHLIAISNQVMAMYQRRTRARFHRIDNPVAPLFFAPSPAPERGRLLLVGNLTARKGVDIAIAAVARLLPHFPQIHLDIIGAPVDATYTTHLHAQAAPLGDAIHFCGPTDQAGVKRALGQAQALVLSSRMEHAPVIVAEAMAAGRPVVATEVGAVADLVAPGETGYLAPPGAVAVIADHLANLLEDAGHAAALGAEAAQRARARFHPDVVAAAYLRAVASAMSAA